MKKLLLFLLVALLCWGCSNRFYDPSLYREFVYVYPDLELTASEILDGYRYGFVRAVEVYPKTWDAVTGDTLLIFIQHQNEKGTVPIHSRIGEADVVIMCYPEDFPQYPHAIKNGRGIVFVVDYPGGARFFVYAENRVDDMWEPIRSKSKYILENLDWIYGKPP